MKEAIASRVIGLARAVLRRRAAERHVLRREIVNVPAEGVGRGDVGEEGDAAGGAVVRGGADEPVVGTSSPAPAMPLAMKMAIWSRETEVAGQYCVALQPDRDAVV